MNLKTSSFSLRDDNVNDLENLSREYPTLDELMSEQNIKSKKENTVHRRRDLDSLG